MIHLHSWFLYFVVLFLNSIYLFFYRKQFSPRDVSVKKKKKRWRSRRRRWTCWSRELSKTSATPSRGTPTCKSRFSASLTPGAALLRGAGARRRLSPAAGTGLFAARAPSTSWPGAARGLGVGRGDSVSHTRVGQASLTGNCSRFGRRFRHRCSPSP